MPVFLECQRCTECCRWPGQVKVDAFEIARMASHLGLSENEFIQQFTRLDADRRGLALTEKPTGECVFLDGGNCLVNPAKPQRCRDFPNLWRYPGAEKICRAVPRQVDDVEFRRLVAEATGRRPEDIALPSQDRSRFLGPAENLKQKT